MPGRLRISLLACGLAAIFSGCGSGDDGTIPSGDSEQMLRLLDAIESEVQNGNCELAQEQADTFSDTVRALPAGVDAEVREGLTDASTQLVALTHQPEQCEEVTGPSGEAGFEPTTTDTTTTEEEESPTTTEEEEPTTTQPEEEPPPEEDGDEGTGEEPLEVPGDGGGSGGRGTDSGGVEPEKRGAR